MRRAAALGLVAIALAGCAPPATSGTATGVVVDVDGDLTSVDSFTITTALGDRMTFVPAPDGDFAFPLPHLQAHVRSGDPIVVDWAREDDVLWAVSLDDAGDSPH
ncbi:MAG: hypothetical protein AB1Z55_11585 [Acidimicrobiia bacterium]